MAEAKLTLKPYKYGILAFQGIYFFLGLLIVFITTRIFNLLFEFNIVSTVTEAISTSMEVIGEFSPDAADQLSWLLHNLILDSFLLVFIVFSVLFLLAIKSKLEVYNDKMVYYKLFSKKEITFNKVKKVYFERKLDFIDLGNIFSSFNIGDVYIELIDEKDPLKLPYINYPEQQVKILSDLVVSKNDQEKNNEYFSRAIQRTRSFN